MRASGAVRVALSMALASCAGLSPSRGHREVSALVQERAGVSTGWEGGPPEEAKIAARVEALLSEGLDRRRAVEIALINNRTLQATYEGLGISQADMVQAGLLSNPVLSGSFGFTANNRGRPEYEASLVQSFLDIFVLPARKRIAREQFGADVLRVAHEALRVAAEASKALVELQAASRRMELRFALVQAAGSAAELLEAQFRAGNVSDLALATEQAHYQQARLDAAEEELDVIEHREALNRILGLWGTQVDRLKVSALEELPQSEEALDALEAAALRQRLDVDAARKQTVLLSNALSLARTSRLFGLVQVGVHVHQDPNGPRLFGPTMSLELPIFDQRQALIGRLEAQRRQADRQLMALSVDARSEVRLARSRMLTARQRAALYRTTLLPLRRRVFEETQLQHNGMQIGLSPLLEAKRGQIESERGQVAAVRDYWLARAELERAMGGRIAVQATGGSP